MEEGERKNQTEPRQEEDETEEVAKKKRDEEGEEEEEVEQIYHDARGEVRRAEESSGMEENRNIQKQVKRSNNVQNLEFPGAMKPTVKEKNL